MKTIKALALTLCLATMAYAATEVIRREKPSSVKVKSVSYDRNLKTIVVSVHADFFFLSIDRVYGIKVKDDKDMEKRLEEILGQTPEVVEIEEN